MKLVLANNQSERFRSFYDELKNQSAELFDYAGYESLLFSFGGADQPVQVKNLTAGRQLTEYDGVYLNGYINTYELAAAMAACCQALRVPFVNQEMANAPSLSKLTSYAKLAAKGVSIPHTLAGPKSALMQAADEIAQLPFPLVLKRADADRGIDNYKVSSAEEVMKLLEPHPPRSLWLLQEHVANNGYYLVSFYNQKPEFGIFRTLEDRPDGDTQKEHMYKPAGGANAHLLEVDNIPAPVRDVCQKAMDAMNRQIGSVDCLYNPENQQVYVLEVNYNPQLVTIETFKETRIKAFLEGISKID